jgi:hypothetical protein
LHVATEGGGQSAARRQCRPGWQTGAVPRAGPAVDLIKGTSSDGVRVWSSGSALDGQPIAYLEDPNGHADRIDFRQIASFEPFMGSGVTVATTSTTDGADLLVSGSASNGAEVREYGLARPDQAATTVAPKLISTLPPLAGVAGAAPLAGR